MAAANIPEKVADFRVYNQGNEFVGVTGEVTLPDLTMMSDTVSGLGILGEIDSPHMGKFGSIEQEVPFRVLYKDLFDIVKDRNIDITMRGAIQLANGEATEYKGIRIVERGIFKGIKTGQLTPGSPMGSSLTFELTYFFLEIDGDEMVELDKYNNVFKIGGTDMLAEIKNLC